MATRNVPRYDLTNQRFGRWKVVSFHACVNSTARWNCICECGTERVVIGISLRNGRSQSCGCLHDEIAARQKFRHGRSRTRAYQIFTSMHQRCENPNSQVYESYGQRGIKVDERWITFERFYADMGDPPKGYSIERKDNNGPYSPENCIWATSREQHRNKRSNRLLTFNGQTFCMTEWAERTGLTVAAIRYRLKKGIPVEQALTTPVDERFSSIARHRIH